MSTLREPSAAYPSDEPAERDHSPPRSGTKIRVVPASAKGGPLSSFKDVYDGTFDFVWRAARRLGVSHAAVDDVVQDTFLVVYRRLDEPRSGALRAWIYGVLVQTARNYRRSLRRKSAHDAPNAVDPDEIANGEVDDPERGAQKAEASRILHEILRALDDEKREIFVLVELEQLSVADASQALAINLNTAYSRLRLARAEFEQAVLRHRARDGSRIP